MYYHHHVMAVISVCEDVSEKKERIDRTNIVFPYHRSYLINLTTYSIFLGFDFYPLEGISGLCPR